MKRICSNGMCKEYKNGNITIKFDKNTIEDAKQDKLLILSSVLSDFDCYFIGESYCLGNFAMGHTVYNAYSDLVYVFDWNLLAMLMNGETVKLYARTPDETDREIMKKEVKQ